MRESGCKWLVDFYLDTNIIIALFKEEHAVLSHLAHAGEVLTTSIVLGELYFGALNSGHPEKNFLRVEEFASQIPVLSNNIGTAKEYAKIKNSLKKKGKPIPENDIWIAASAIEHNLILITRDEHFKNITDLKMDKW